jgi:hypothetical protein
LNAKLNKNKVEIMKFRTLFTLSALLIAVVTSAAAFDTNLNTTLPSDCEVKLFYGKEITLTQPMMQELYSNAVILLKSSNFDSVKNNRGWDDPEFKVHALQEHYRQTIAADKYLVISFKEPLKMETVGGMVIANEIITEINRTASIGLYTVDDENRLVGHEMFNGSRFAKLMDLTEKITKDFDK